MHEKLVIRQDITVFHCDGDQKLIHHRLKNTFWEEVAASWFKLTHINDPSGRQILFKPLWYNKDIRLNISLNKKRMIDKGIIQIKDIYDTAEKRLMTGNELQMLYNTSNFLVWNSLLHTIPEKWKCTLEREKPLDMEVPDIFNTVASIHKCAQWAYPTLLQAIPVTTPTKAFNKWQVELDLTTVSWSSLFNKLYRSTSDFKLRWFQLRIMHRIIPSNSRLFIYGIRPSDSCERCPGARESLLHLFWLCPAVLHFWTQLRRTLGLRDALSAPSVILGINFGCSRISESHMYLCTLLGKWYIWRCRYTKTIPNMQGFIRMCMDYICIEKYSAVVTNTMPKFNRKWLQLNEILKNSKQPP